MAARPNTINSSGGVSLTGVRFRYPRGFELNIPAMEIAGGEQVLLAGPSGSGKSTLLHLIAGLEEPTQGEIHIAGTNIFQLRAGARDIFRGRHIGMIFQTFNLLQGFSALENVMLALMLAGYASHDQRARALAALDRLGINEPDARVEALSVGQQQRVAVARAVAGEPCVVLADEPTASLDPANATTSIALIQEAARNSGAALIVTSHDPSLRSAFTRVIEVAA
ncbi:MAG: ABC transporter ATP-binding protein [Phycisphaerales bacterium]|nr:ABC transporter ATP-binding protein [Phycisphaerales bacterium]